MGKSNVPLLSETTLITYVENLAGNPVNGVQTLNILGWDVPQKDIYVLGALFLFIVMVSLLLYFFFKTHLGTSMRATGNNQQMIRALAVNTNLMIVLGLALSNGMIAISGSILAQFQGFADVQMGIGMMVWGLASVIIGEVLVGEKSLGFLIIGAVFGSVIFRLLVAVALRMGMNPNDLKLITAVFVFIALVLPGLMNSFKKKGVTQS